MEQYYKIAGLVTKFPCTGRTSMQALPYRCAPCQGVDISIPLERIQNTCKKWKEEMPQVSDDMLEYMATGALFYLYLLQHDGLMLHSSAVVVDGKAYLFTADPGTGKSTHTSLWLKQFGDRAYILNDDKPALRLEDGKWYAYGTPWSGKYDLSSNCRAELAGIAVLERGEINSIEPFGGLDAIFSIFAQVNRTKLSEDRIKLMELLDKLISHIPVWKLCCNMNPDAVNVAYQAMSQGYSQEEHI